MRLSFRESRISDSIDDSLFDVVWVSTSEIDVRLSIRDVYSKLGSRSNVFANSLLYCLAWDTVLCFSVAFVLQQQEVSGKK